MSRLKLFSVIAILFLTFSAFTLDTALAGEKMKWHGTGITVKWEQMEVGDVEGHVVGIQKSKQIYINEATGEKSVSISIGLMDINPKMKKVFGHGYGVSFYQDGSKSFRSWKGHAVSKGQWKGEWTITGGTGRHEGTTGGGTWTQWALAPEGSYLEVEGDINVP